MLSGMDFFDDLSTNSMESFAAASLRWMATSKSCTQMSFSRGPAPRNDAADGRGPERRRATGLTTLRQQGAGLRVSPGARDSESSASHLDAACAGYLLF